MLSSKPDTLTRRWDVYSKGSNTPLSNSNRRPIFLSQQVSTEAKTGRLQDTLINPTPMLDDDLLLHDIWVALTEDPSVTQTPKNPSCKGANSLELGHDGLLRHNNRVFVPDTGNLRLRILKSRHNHPLAGHFGLTKTLELLRQDFTWPRLWEFVTDYMKTCNVCLRNKPRHHRPYSLLNQLPISLRP